MSTSEDRGRLAEGVELTHEKQVELACVLKDKRYSNAAIANIMRISESTVRTLLETPAKIEWGYNCLTESVHHGRPEKIWNLPLLYAVQIYSAEQLKRLVVARIYNDAMQYVDNSPFTQKGTGKSFSFANEWAEQIKQYAEDWLPSTLQHTVGEIAQYYKSNNRQTDVDQVVERVEMNKLNPGYAPLHGHDSINLLCRILGTCCAREASKNHG